MMVPFLTGAHSRRAHLPAAPKPANPSKQTALRDRSFVKGCAVAAIGGWAFDGLCSAGRGDWPGAGICVAISLVTVLMWRAWTRYDTRCRWREAIQRRDELQRLRAERVRLHKPVQDIDAELRPLVNRMIGGAV